MHSMHFPRLVPRAFRAWLASAYLRFCLTVGLSLILVQGATALDVGIHAQSLQEQEMYNIARELWCPLCAGIRLDACELQACVQMREEISLLLAEGRDKAYIIAYFEEQYGTQVHGQPPFTGIYGWAWWTPLLLMAAAGITIGNRMRRAAATRRDSSQRTAAP